MLIIPNRGFLIACAIAPIAYDDTVPPEKKPGFSYFQKHVTYLKLLLSHAMKV